MKTSKFTINSRVPICPLCNAKLKFSQKYFMYTCWDCKTEYHVIEDGQNEHEFITITYPLKKGQRNYD